MWNKAVLVLFWTIALWGCSEGKKYRDTTALETPPRLAINEEASSQQGPGQQEAEKGDVQIAFVDDVETPSVLKIKKLFDRAWDMVGQALEKNGIEVTDKNRDKGVYFVKYEPSEDGGKRLFGNVRFYIFEEKYQTAPYKLTIVWRDTETEVRAKMLPLPESEIDDEGEEPADGSSKLLKALYDTIKDEKVE